VSEGEEGEVIRVSNSGILWEKAQKPRARSRPALGCTEKKKKKKKNRPNVRSFVGITKSRTI
jgi:hypothetical protein